MRHRFLSTLKLFALLAFGVLPGFAPGFAYAFSKAPTAPLFFRGMTEKQASIESVIQRMAGAGKSVIPSWRFSYLATKNSGLDQLALREMLDRDIAFWRRSATLGRFLECHSDFYECRYPKMSVLRAESFQMQMAINDTSEDISQLGFEKAQELFSHFDPVISTSISKQVAQSFVRDKEEAKGFLLAVFDLNHRNCPEAAAESDNSKCIIQMTEYAEEQEFPFLGYVLPEEIYSLERLGTSVTRVLDVPGTLEIQTTGDTSFWKCGGNKIPKKFYDRLDPTIADALQRVERQCQANAG
ncbi:hypothetical protein WDW86_05115 [Bdellovibrionota bacterium FG-2]